jgi:hypothetical protein
VCGLYKRAYRIAVYPQLLDRGLSPQNCFVAGAAYFERYLSIDQTQSSYHIENSATTYDELIGLLY